MGKVHRTGTLLLAKILIYSMLGFLIKDLPLTNWWCVFVLFCAVELVKEQEVYRRLINDLADKAEGKGNGT